MLRNKKIDLPSLFISEAHLRPAFDSLINQGMVLVTFCAALILTMWNFELLTTVSSLYMASECTIVLFVCWLAQGVFLLSQADQKLAQWREYEETATDADYLKLKE